MGRVLSGRIGWIPFETTPGYIDQEEIGVSEDTGHWDRIHYEAPDKDYMAQEEPVPWKRIRGQKRMEGDACLGTSASFTSAAGFDWAIRFIVEDSF